MIKFHIKCALLIPIVHFMVPRGRGRNRAERGSLSFIRAGRKQGEELLALPSPPSGLPLPKTGLLIHSLPNPDDVASHFAPNPFCPISNFSERTLPLRTHVALSNRACPAIGAVVPFTSLPSASWPLGNRQGPKPS